MLGFGREVGGTGFNGGGSAQGNALSTPYTDRFGLSLAADKTLAKRRLLPAGLTQLFEVPVNQVFITSNIWLWLTNTSAECSVELYHTLQGDNTQIGDVYWGTTLNAQNPWTILQVQKVFETESKFSISSSIGSVLNLNVDGSIIETQ